jgi:hypothetical protein
MLAPVSLLVASIFTHLPIAFYLSLVAVVDHGYSLSFFILIWEIFNTYPDDVLFVWLFAFRSYTFVVRPANFLFQ